MAKVNQKMQSSDILKIAKEVFVSEETALKDTAKILGKNFAKAVMLVSKSGGRLVVVGIGKSGHIGRKISATLASTGTPSFFVHPTEALHGDLGMITDKDIVLALSFSGETEELSKILTPLKKEKIKIIALTGHKNSTLGKMSDICLEVKIKREACPYNLAPTSSTTAMLALGDALAICLMKIKNFHKEDFAFFHPGGTLGKLLTYFVKDIMFKGKNPVVLEGATVQDALFVMTKNKTGAAAIVDKKGYLKGFFTDGDLRRLLQKKQDVLDLKIAEVMTKNPFAFPQDMPAIEAAKIINARKFDNAPVVDKKNKVIGFLDKDNLIEFIALAKK